MVDELEGILEDPDDNDALRWIVHFSDVTANINPEETNLDLKLADVVSKFHNSGFDLQDLDKDHVRSSRDLVLISLARMSEGKTMTGHVRRSAEPLLGEVSFAFSDEEEGYNDDFGIA